jgi:hypothetical protein
MKRAMTKKQLDDAADDKIRQLAKLVVDTVSETVGTAESRKKAKKLYDESLKLLRKASPSGWSAITGRDAGRKSPMSKEVRKLLKKGQKP